jgi:hypothetical protein
MTLVCLIVATKPVTPYSPEKPETRPKKPHKTLPWSAEQLPVVPNANRELRRSERDEFANLLTNHREYDYAYAIWCGVWWLGVYARRLTEDLFGTGGSADEQCHTPRDHVVLVDFAS